MKAYPNLSTEYYETVRMETRSYKQWDSQMIIR